jgi:hypothetical protein
LFHHSSIKWLSWNWNLIVMIWTVILKTNLFFKCSVKYLLRWFLEGWVNTFMILLNLIIFQLSSNSYQYIIFILNHSKLVFINLNSLDCLEFVFNILIIFAVITLRLFTVFYFLRMYYEWFIFELILSDLRSDTYIFILIFINYKAILHLFQHSLPWKWRFAIDLYAIDVILIRLFTVIHSFKICLKDCIL